MIRVEPHQNIIDIAVQVHGSKWVTGLMNLLRDNTLDLKDDPAVGTPLVVSGVDESDSVLKALKRDNVKVATGVPNIVLVDGSGAYIVDGQDNKILVS